MEAGTDLFGVWVVEIGYGRIGTAGHQARYPPHNEETAKRLVRRILQRRAHREEAHRGRLSALRVG